MPLLLALPSQDLQWCNPALPTKAYPMIYHTMEPKHYFVLQHLFLANVLLTNHCIFSDANQFLGSANGGAKIP